MSVDQGRAEWLALVEEIDRAEPSDSLGDWKPESLDAPLPPSVRAYVHHRSKSVQECKQRFIPQVSYRESMRPQPATVHATDAFVAKNLDITIPSGKQEGTDFEHMVVDHVLKNPLGRDSDGAPPLKIPRRIHLAAGEKAVDFSPIILVPPNASATFQLCNIRAFLEAGEYHEPVSMWTDNEGQARRMDMPQSECVTPGPFLHNIDRFRVKFRNFLVVSDESQIANWDHVCAAFLTGKSWQFEKWYDGDAEKTAPGTLFYNIRGFLPYFEEDVEPKEVRQWRVVPLLMSRKRSKMYSSVKTAAVFWQELFTMLDTHPNFRQYTAIPRSVLDLGY